MLDKKYNHIEVEKNKYETWKSKDYFKSDSKSSKEPFCIVIPPPNVTGKLHIGHAWDVTLQDLIIRYKRMQGYDCLWLPGMDHAGIATQSKIDKRLKEQGIMPRSMSREDWLEQAWAWKDEYANTIHEQWAKLGISVDYSKERFTLDQGLSHAVNEVFIRLYNKGLIYRGERIINWDPEQMTALSTEEVIYKEDKGAFYHIKYFIEGTEDYLDVATTRPETLFGDTAVAVNPKDKRYNHLIGKNAILPVVNKLIPIIGDEHADPEFGTGVVKITPAHDPNDFEVGNRHNLERVVVMNKDATMNENAGKYQGLTREECREQLVKDLEKEDLLIKIEPMVHSVGHSERSDAVVEPYLSKQWFVKMRPLADRVLENQKDKENKVNFVPSRYEKVMNHWMEITYDWCISRQLWWGHRIPAWYKDDKIKVQTTSPGEGWVQDPDVLDTWFSSALAPFAFLGWPDLDDELYKRFYPLDVMVTAYDIIFFWVERMAFQGVHFTGEMPFKKVYIHGLVRDSQGRKMSKSLGNGIDPFDVIKQYGTDSLRFALATGGTPGLDINFSFKKVEQAHNFLNKVWNASRYLLSMLPTSFVPHDLKEEELSFLDQWILKESDNLIEKVNTNMEKYELGQAAEYLYSFVYEEFCSEYLEYSKVSMTLSEERKDTTLNVLYQILKKVLIVLFPFAPFISEEIYSYLPDHKKSIYEEAYPEAFGFAYQEAALDLSYSLGDAIREVRNHKSTLQMAPNAPISLLFFGTENDLEAVNPYLTRFAFAREIKPISENRKDLIHFASFSLGFDEEESEENRERINARIAFLKKEIERSEKMLHNENFLNKAKPEKVQEEKNKYQKYLDELAKYSH